jgi:hypothetical protein
VVGAITLVVLACALIASASEHKRAEEALRQARADLARINRVRAPWLDPAEMPALHGAALRLAFDDIGPLIGLTYEERSAARRGGSGRAMFPARR